MVEKKPDLDQAEFMDQGPKAESLPSTASQALAEDSEHLMGELATAWTRRWPVAAELEGVWPWLHVEKRIPKGGRAFALSLRFIPGHSKGSLRVSPGLECKWRISCLSRRTGKRSFPVTS